MTHLSATKASRAEELVRELQSQFAAALDEVAINHGEHRACTPVSWLRNEGLYGGGTRMEAPTGIVFNRASINVSVINYEKNPDKTLSSATAISAIVHPKNPNAPSMHMHISWTEMKDGRGYWRVMADLNPSNTNNAHKEQFEACLKAAAPDQFEEATAQGDRYFFIPALNRHRGVQHFYLEAYNSTDFEADLKMAQAVGVAVIENYAQIINDAMNEEPTKEQQANQLAYHTLYLFQVLTLDRGTTSGLMVHSENDVGIMGSLPSHVNPTLLLSWQDVVPDLQKPLVVALANCLTTDEITPEVKQRLASAVRAHYKTYPEALALQARGNVIPPTVANHK